MSILVIAGYYNKYGGDGYPTGEKELLVSFGIDMDTDKIVVLPNVHPSDIGAVFDKQYNEYIIPD